MSPVGDNGQQIPRWFRSFLDEYRKDREEYREFRKEYHEFLVEYRKDREEAREDREFVHGALRTLAQSQERILFELRDLSGQFHEAQKETNARLSHLEREQARTNQELARTNQELARTNQELKRTRQQSAKLFARLIAEVKALRRPLK